MTTWFVHCSPALPCIRCFLQIAWGEKTSAIEALIQQLCKQIKDGQSKPADQKTKFDLRPSQRLWTVWHIYWLVGLDENAWITSVTRDIPHPFMVRVGFRSGFCQKNCNAFSSIRCVTARHAANSLAAVHPLLMVHRTWRLLCSWCHPGQSVTVPFAFPWTRSTPTATDRLFRMHWWLHCSWGHLDSTLLWASARPLIWESQRQLPLTAFFASADGRTVADVILANLAVVAMLATLWHCLRVRVLPATPFQITNSSSS